MLSTILLKVLQLFSLISLSYEIPDDLRESIGNKSWRAKYMPILFRYNWFIDLVNSDASNITFIRYSITNHLWSTVELDLVYNLIWTFLPIPRNVLRWQWSVLAIHIATCQTTYLNSELSLKNTAHRKRGSSWQSRIGNVTWLKFKVTII